MNKYIDSDYKEGERYLKISLTNAIEAVYNKRVKKITYPKSIPMNLLSEIVTNEKLPLDKTTTDAFLNYEISFKEISFCIKGNILKGSIEIFNK